MNHISARYPSGYCFYMWALLLYENPPKEIICVLPNKIKLQDLRSQLPYNAVVSVKEDSKEYPLRNNKTTFYVCEKGVCHAPLNHLPGYGEK